MNVQQNIVTGQAVASTHRVLPVAPVAAQRFSADLPSGPDQLDRGEAAGFLAEVVLHRAVETPFCIGIFGPPGSGKSMFLADVLRAVERLGEAAGHAGVATPFEARIAIVRAVAERGVDAAVSLGRQIGNALAVRYPRLASEALQVGLDPRAGARDAGDRLNDARLRLDAERRSLDLLSGRHASLGDTVLFETPGSRIDGYARSNRGRIERAMRRFGATGDPTIAYKSAVREAGEASGPVSRYSGWLRALWAYRGQSRLLLLALAFLLAAWGLSALVANEAKLAEAVRGGGDRMGPLADWLQAQWHWLEPLKSLLVLGAAGALAINVIRAARYLLPIHRGATLLRADLESRRRELDGLLAHQTRRVDTLARDAERAGEHAALAERRLASADPTGDRGPAVVHGGPAAEARAFASVLSRAMQNSAEGSDNPSRIVVAIDGLEALPAREAAELVQTARHLLQVPGFVMLLAAERMHLADGLAETDAALAKTHLDRIVQIPYALGREGEGWNEASRFARALLGADPEPDTRRAETRPDAATSLLDKPWSLAETAVVEALAPFSGVSPRAVKRFVNLYRVARADPRMQSVGIKELAALALGLAVPAETAADPSGTVYPDAHDNVAAARRAAGAALGALLVPREGERGAEVARLYSTGG